MTKLFKAYLVFGFSLLIIGILFDFLFVQTKMSNMFKADPLMYLNSWEKQLYDLTKFYLILLGIISILLAIIINYLPDLTKLDWVIFYLLTSGSLLIIFTGIRYAVAGHSFKWELRCTVLTVGIFATVAGLGMVLYRFLNIAEKRKINTFN